MFVVEMLLGIFKVFYFINIQLDIQSFVGFSVELVLYEFKDLILEQYYNVVVLIIWMMKYFVDVVKYLKSLCWIQVFVVGVDDILVVGFD